MIVVILASFLLGIIFAEILKMKICHSCGKLIFSWQPKTGHVIHEFGRENEKSSVRSYFTLGDKVRRFAGNPQRATGRIGEVVEVGEENSDGCLIGVKWGGAIGRTYKRENDLIVVS